MVGWAHRQKMNIGEGSSLGPKINRDGKSHERVRKMVGAQSIAVVALCVMQCNHTHLADWVGLLRDPRAGNWNGAVAVVMDRTNAAILKRGTINVSSALLPRKWEQSLARGLYDVRGVSSTRVASVRAGLLHIRVMALKTRLFEMPELRHFETLLYIDLDCWAMQSVHRALDSPGVLDAVRDMGMAADTTNERSATVIVMRNTANATACLREWRARIMLNINIFLAFSSKPGMGAKRCAGGKPHRVRARHGIKDSSRFPCFKDQAALDQALKLRACRDAVVTVPSPVVHWTAWLDRYHLRAAKLLENPSRFLGLMRWAQKRNMGFLRSAQKGMRSSLSLVPALAQPCFVHTGRWERERTLL